MSAVVAETQWVYVVSESDGEAWLPLRVYETHQDATRAVGMLMQARAWRRRHDAGDVDVSWAVHRTMFHPEDGA